MPISTRSSNSDALGRYYTRSDISSLLIDQIDNHQPRRLLDLGAGAGSLSIAAANRWSNLELLTVDIDNIASEKYKYRKNNSKLKHWHICADALSNELPSILNNVERPIDLAVCNPPFIIPKWCDHYSEILEKSGFSHCLPLSASIDAAALFLAQNLRLLSDDSTLGIILPDSIVSSEKYTGFREKLLTNYEVEKIIQLPRGSFHGTDALASIFIIKKCSHISHTISIYKLNSDKVLSEKLTIQKNIGYKRLDYDYHFQHSKINLSRATVTLAESGTSVNRGSFSSSEARDFELPVLHTSHIHADDYGKWRNLSAFNITTSDLSAAVTAEPGDILVARVGRNLETKVLGISTGKVFLTDCLYRIRAPNELREKILSELSSERGRQWLSAHAYGVAAKHLSKSDLLSFPFSLN